MDHFEAESILRDLAAVFARDGGQSGGRQTSSDPPLPNLEAKYRTLVEQVPAVVFMAYLDRGIGEAYVSPADRGGHGILSGGMAGGSGSLVRPHSSGGPAPLECRGG